ncbi:MAG: TonB-dependent receptor plug domain-containing protein, partial [Kordiimonadaceae bacterium]|nr:TonB-dependent receptor plug domain-containing protein [Kordiimonadaceae bacterium]
MSDTFKNIIKASLLASVAFTAPLVVAPVVSAQAEENVDEIIVTASRRPQPLSEIGASISVIGAEALAEAQFTFVADALQTLPSVSVNSNGAFGGQAAISIRGAATAQTVILIDGVQLNDVSSPGGGFNFGTLDTSGIARIEVLKGPQAVLYGSDAIGGVVNIITKTGGEGFGGGVYGEYG